MDLTRRLVTSLGISSISTEICQLYIDDPVGHFCDEDANADVETIKEIKATIEAISREEIPNSDHIKLVFAFLLSVQNNTTDPNGDLPLSIISHFSV